MSDSIKQRFNTRESFISVCNYPDPQYGIRELNAVAWHSERTLKPLAHGNRMVVVIAEKIPNHTQYLEGKNMLILRSWKKGSPFALFTILKRILEFSKIKTVLFQFEFNMFGGMTPLVFAPLVLALVKMSGKRIVFELHQVVLDIKELANHVNVKNPFLQWAFNLGLHLFYFSVGLFADEVLVLEEDLKKRLHNLVYEDKIVFVPIAIETKRNLPQQQAKQKLGISPDDFCILVFGFINWYKGSDWIVKAIRGSHQKHVRLLMAGGESPTLKDKSYYQRFYKKIEAAARASNKVILTGFVPDDSIKLYFSAADLVVLPYRVFMSASGPFSLALSYRKPVLLSNRLYDYTHSQDFSDSMEYAGLTKTDLFFPFHAGKFDEIIKHIRKQEDYKAQLTTFSRKLAGKRSTEAMVERLKEILVPTYVIKGHVSFRHGGDRRLYALKNI
ncbi:MAG: glycosyltransferase [Patescibacteria group bacterium]|nr:glycosyltransferase [Patescibacteria group bacterium]